MEINSKEILYNSKQSLLTLAEGLNDVEIVEHQNFDLQVTQFRTIASFETSINIKKNPFPIIYTIEILNTEAKKDLIEKFKKFTKENKTKTKSVDRINHSKYNATNSNILYVGSSINDFKSRLKDHLGVKKGLRTYGLHLCKWDNGIDYILKVRTYEIRFPSSVGRSLVELIEQQIWDQLQPVFGKRSGLL
jgi:hypothetical protein